MRLKRLFANIGPGPLVTSAFIGPGSVTLCTLAGAQFGYSLLWALLIAVAATMVLQEMSLRLGVAAGLSLSEAVRLHIPRPLPRHLTTALVLAAIVIGNAAYEAGNISGSRLGLQTLVGDTEVALFGHSFNYLSAVIGALAFALLFIGNYRLLERALIALVALMSICFVVTAAVTRPDIGALAAGLLIPTFSDQSALMVVGLIGTTVVPYNLFLHSNLAREKWNTAAGPAGNPDRALNHNPDRDHNLNLNLEYAKKDMAVAVILGGIISLSIVICAAAIQHSEVNNAADLARALEPLLGAFARYFLALGLFAAGISSAIMAPLAAAYVVAGCFDWPRDMKTWRFRGVWMTIVLLGVIFSSLGVSPIEVIRFAQVTNGIVLPVIAGFLLWMVNKPAALGIHVNTARQNILGAVVLLITVLLGINGILKALG